ncbi:MAG: DUF1822 family protein [Leptolyngbya sp. IPPAS B-1204]|nr:MAG: DUF1822 family protein [Leptolyngbya sp. IPPAS B-1204]
MNFFLDDELITAQLLSPEGISLAPEQINWALELSQQATTEAERWQTYLSGLALLGVQEWLQQRLPDLALKSDWLPGRNLSVTKAKQAALSQQVCQLQIGEFRLYLLLTDCLEDPMVAIPKAIVDLTEFAPDFYLLVEVLEELAEVRVYGYLPGSQLIARAHQQTPTIQFDPQLDPETMLLPVDQFTHEVDTLLLHLRHSDAAALRTASAASRPASPHSPLSPSPAINVGAWLRNRLDQVAEELSWLLLPPVAFNLEGSMMAMRSARSPIEDLDAVITELIREHRLEISPEARSAYWDFQVGTTALRLYVLGWALASAADSPEWSLLLVLGAQPSTHLPSGTVLKVEDAMQVLAEEQLDQSPYLYAQVAGTWDEQFRVTVALPNGESLVLPPFAFNPDAIDPRPA